MGQHHPRCAQVVELRFFGDLEFQEIAEVMNLSLSSVERDWRFARAWLRKNMAGVEA
jgi:DNA-directed RNA polymerase specialized sigma24 family protein